jgi:uncharacterized membrane protein
MAREDEDRILRVWTPVILRVSVTTSAVILVIGLIIIGMYGPQRFVERFHELQAPGVTFPQERWTELFGQGLRGQPRAVLMVGLLVLTLVPIGRVAFAFVFFLKERDTYFIFLTATVLTLLILGVVLGRVG